MSSANIRRAGARRLVARRRAGGAAPGVLGLDEATSSVGALPEVRIPRALTHLAEGRPTIAIAHRLSTAARADRVLVLQGGSVVYAGKPSGYAAAAAEAFG